MRVINGGCGRDGRGGEVLGGEDGGEVKVRCKKGGEGDGGEVLREMKRAVVRYQRMEIVHGRCWGQ